MFHMSGDPSAASNHWEENWVCLWLMMRRHASRLRHLQRFLFFFTLSRYGSRLSIHRLSYSSGFCVDPERVFDTLSFCKWSQPTLTVGQYRLWKSHIRVLCRFSGGQERRCAGGNHWALKGINQLVFSRELLGRGKLIFSRNPWLEGAEGWEWDSAGTRQPIQAEYVWRTYSRCVQGKETVQHALVQYPGYWSFVEQLLTRIFLVISQFHRENRPVAFYWPGSKGSFHLSGGYGENCGVVNEVECTEDTFEEFYSLITVVNCCYQSIYVILCSAPLVPCFVFYCLFDPCGQ